MFLFHLLLGALDKAFCLLARRGNDIVRLLIGYLDGIFMDHRSFLFRVGEDGLRTLLHLFHFVVQLGVFLFDLFNLRLALFDHALDRLKK